jgi:C-terminal binding protein
MNKTVWITPHIIEPSLERDILGEAYSADAHAGIEVALVWREQVGEEFLANFPKLRAVIRYGVGYENIDLSVTDKHGVIACNNPSYGVEEVSDTAVAMILSLSRGISSYDADATALNPMWQQRVNRSLHRTSTLKVGVIGAGRIGGRTLLKCRALGFQATFYDPYLPQGYEKLLGCRRSDSMAALLKDADVISIHAPLTTETKDLIDDEFIAAMRPGSMLVNTARGGILKNIDLLYEPLKAGHIASVALDVLPQEPPQHSKLIDAWRQREPWLAGRLLINPHSAYYSQEAEIEMRQTVAQNAMRVLSGLLPWNIVGSHMSS